MTMGVMVNKRRGGWSRYQPAPPPREEVRRPPSRWARSLQGRVLAENDRRVTLITEVLQSLRAIKLNAPAATDCGGGGLVQFRISPPPLWPSPLPPRSQVVIIFGKNRCTSKVCEPSLGLLSTMVSCSAVTDIPVLLPCSLVGPLFSRLIFSAPPVPMLDIFFSDLGTCDFVPIFRQCSTSVYFVCSQSPAILHVHILSPVEVSSAWEPIFAARVTDQREQGFGDRQIFGA